MSVMPSAATADVVVAHRGHRRSAQILGRFAVGEHGLAFWASLWSAALAAELAALAPLAYEDRTSLRAQDIVFVLAAGSFMACGLIAWRRRPDNHSGRLMTATGFAALAYPLLIQIDAPLATTPAMLFSTAWTIGYTALLLSFMTGGRLVATIDRLLVATFALTSFVAQFALLLVYPAPGNLLLISSNTTAADAINDSARWVTAGASIMLVVVLVSRWRGASKPRRRALLPGVVGILSSALYSVLLVQAIVAETPADVVWLTANLALLLVPGAYLFGLLRSRLARTGLASLILELRTMHGAELEAALGRALGDSGLQVVHGDVPAEPAPGQSVARIERDGRPVAALMYDETLDDDPELVEAVSAAAALALEHERLHAELRAQLEEVRGSRARILEAGLKERQRLERNLHDGAQQRLVALSLQLSLLEGRLAGDPDARATVDEARREIAASLSELRDLARGLHPAVVSSHGLEVALEQVVARASVPVELRIDTHGRLPEPVEVATFYLVSECLANVGKYAQATSVSVAVMRRGAEVVVEVVDNGCGGADEERGSGIRGLADRVEALGGRLRIWSPAGGGTRVQAEIPCAS